MQPAQNVFDRTGMIVLYKANASPDGVIETFLVEAFEKESARILVDRRF